MKGHLENRNVEFTMDGEVWVLKKKDGSVIAEGLATITQVTAAPSVPIGTQQTGIANQIRKYLTHPVNKDVDIEARTLLATAADEADKFYNGMVAWKATAQTAEALVAKAQDFNGVVARWDFIEGEQFRNDFDGEWVRVEDVQSLPDDRIAAGHFVMSKGGAWNQVDKTYADGATILYHAKGWPAEGARSKFEMSNAAKDVLAERERQKTAWSADRDDEYRQFQLGRAAATYALIASMQEPERSVVDSNGVSAVAESLKKFWPWSHGWLKPKNRRRDLVKAGALILAEIERLDRKGKESK